MTRVDLSPTVTIYHGDCLDVLPTLGDASVDMVWIDPPYGHGNHDGDFNARLNEHRGLEQQPIANDDQDSMMHVIGSSLEMCVRILKNKACCCCCCCGGGGPRPTFAWVAQRLDTNGMRFFHSVIWDKCNPGLGWRYRRQHEMVMVAHKDNGGLSWNPERPACSNIVRMSKPKECRHPNEKPLALPQLFIENHTVAGDVVLDFFMGSGTTGVACIRTGRRFIGVELDEKHFATAMDVLQRELRQPSLFDFSNSPKDEQQNLFDID